jgi:hypothetical protein
MKKTHLYEQTPNITGVLSSTTAGTAEGQHP